MNLRRDRVAQALTFLLPIVFFSIFASGLRRPGRRCHAARIRSPSSTRIAPSSAARVVAALQQGDRRCASASTATETAARARSRRPPSAGRATATCRSPSSSRKASARAFGQLGFAASGPPIQLLADASDPIAPQMVQGLLQKVTMTAAPDLVMQGGMKQFEKHAGALTPRAAHGRRRVAAAAEGRRRGHGAAATGGVRRRWASPSTSST